MSDLSTEIQDKLEDAWLARVKRVAFGLSTDDQGLAQTVRRVAYHDGITDLTLPAVVVQAEAATSENGVDARLYAVRVSLVALTYDDDDPDMTDLHIIHGNLQLLASTAQGTSLATLNALLTPMTCHGVDIVGDTPGPEENWQSLSVDLVCHVHATLSAPTTTTTTTTS